MPAISIKDVARFYAELDNQNQALDMLQFELSKLGLTSDQAAWVIKYREQPEALIPLPGKSIAATESIRTTKTTELDWNNPNCFISKYFTVAEVTMRDRRRIPQKDSWAAQNILSFAKELDKVREAWGHPLGVSSWFRPEPINAQKGGVRGSKHTLGLAADIFPLAGGNVMDLQRWLDHRWLDALGYGAAYKGFVHLDTRGGGGLDKVGFEGKTRWDY